MRTDEQMIHDRINLPRLVKRLEQSVQEDDWTKSSPRNRDTWIKAQATLQKIRHAQLLLKNVELDDDDATPASERRYQHFRTTLEHLQDYMLRVEQQVAPPIRRPKALLPSMRPPVAKSPATRETAESQNPPVEATLIPAEPSPSTPDVDLVPTPSTLPEPRVFENASTSSAVAAPTSSKIIATPTILQNSRALQDELAEQLALMATQLRRNATHFSESLQNDKTVMEVMQEKLEGNFDFMKRERIRLRDFRGKSGGTTCLAIMSVIVVLVAFILMVFLVRVT
ncbi:hypothetical protein PAXRUDRAFT_827848 [Paxillus rubicundulus Ve08.2h10]|uniref:Unplaced genomic scaffold scaffold_275, whole genome shotgun sequence n=1 Tax=Paxillus rubicundulus Ve08.2h10 TaxID=930991 RepID=A0A0D0DX39_9AGAM|nr:hypothetical protein PAXRUDRAFT_827848 [Paxillus rubicundulus Ve08.2h10]